jgi:hypothetical protein
MSNFFMVATHTRTLRNPRSPDRSDAAWQDNERFEVVKNLKANKQAIASIILDVKRRHIVKNRFDNSRTFDELYAYFLENYKDYINEWLERELASR